MHSKLIRSLGIVMLLGVAAAPACTANVDDINVNIDDVKVSLETDVDVDDIEQGQAVPIDIQVETLYLVDPSEEPPPDKVEVAGHLQFYFDTFESEPIIITADTHVEIMIPADAEPGDHKVLCRAHKHDGTPTKATFELAIKVKARVSSS
jgi:hypothetical protein